MLGDVVSFNRAGRLFNIHLFLEGIPVNHRFYGGKRSVDGCVRTADGSWEFLQPVLKENKGDVIHLWKPDPCP